MSSFTWLRRRLMTYPAAEKIRSHWALIRGISEKLSDIDCSRTERVLRLSDWRFNCVKGWKRGCLVDISTTKNRLLQSAARYREWL